MSAGVTPRQLQLLGFIAEHIEAYGYAPTFAEMATEIGVTSKGHISQIVNGLEERGHITRVRDRKQSITIIDSDIVRNALRFRSLADKRQRVSS